MLKDPYGPTDQPLDYERIPESPRWIVKLAWAIFIVVLVLICIP